MKKIFFNNYGKNTYKIFNFQIKTLKLKKDKELGQMNIFY